MLEQTIRRIVAEYGWLMTSEYKVGTWPFDFHRKTRSGVGFCFSVELTDYKLNGLIREIISFVDALDPEQCAWEWMVKSGAVHPSCYETAVDDLDEMRLKVWLLACKLSEVADGLFPLSLLELTDTTASHALLFFRFLPFLGNPPAL